MSTSLFDQSQSAQQQASAAASQTTEPLTPPHKAAHMIELPFENTSDDNNSTKLNTKSQQSSSDSGKNQLLTERSTAMHTNAVSSDDEEDSGAEQDLASLPPLDGFDYHGLLWPETDVVDLPVVQYGREIHLKSYRWPATGERKGVIFMLHGYGACAAQMAVIAKFIAAEGYEIFAMDMRGHGDSEGERGVFESADNFYNDYWALIFGACKKFRINQQKTSIFLFGRSFGGLIATNLANTTIGRSMFKGVVLLSPYYRLFTERLYESYKYLVPLTNIHPNQKFYSEFAEMDPDYLARYREIFEDPRNINFFTATTARAWIEEQDKARTSIEQAPQPICFITATADGVVRNDYIEDFARIAQHEMNEFHEVQGADHTDICFNEHYGSQMCRTTTKFLHKLVKEIEQEKQARIASAQQNMRL